MSLWLGTSSQEGFPCDCVSGLEYVCLYVIVWCYVWSFCALRVGTHRHDRYFVWDDVVVVFEFSVVVVCVLNLSLYAKKQDVMCQVLCSCVSARLLLCADMM